MKTSKRIVSLLLTASMILSCFAVAIPFFKLEASAADIITINGVSQERIVGTDGSYQTTYDKYAAEFLNGHSQPTNIVIPGLSNEDDYVTQGMAYYPQKDWMLITAYHGNTAEAATANPSMVFCIDNVTGEFVAMFSFINVDGTANTDHGGGIAISENNIYYACGDKDRKIAYAPLSALDGIENEADKYREIQLVAEQDFYEIGSVTKSDKTAYTAYVCYDQGVLWTGNFYDEGAVLGFIAADYNAPANDAANSMVWGYRLSGSTPAEEWANLMGATGKDCQGNPSYVVALSDNIKDVQYAVVDNGKIYISQSYGTGKGTMSVSVGGMDDYSHLTVADIDLSVPGNKTITFKTDANGTTRTVNDAYHVNWYQTFDFMPMSEGLCVINDYVFMTFESACYKYREKAGVMGNCQMPVDVVWKMDQHALLGEERPDDCASMYYDKVTSLSQIEDGEEYMIIYESPEKDPVTMKNYIYALSSNGGFHDYKLAKRYATGSEGYAGAVGHVIKDYEITDGRLYLHDPENDDLVENRWTITGANTGNLRIKSASTYFSNYRNFYFNKDVIAMTNDASNDLNNIGIMEAGNGSFYLYYDTNGTATAGGETYLWCNDFSVAGYETKVNNWYTNKAASNAKMYSGLKETKGTFHTDGLGTNNVIGQSVGENVYLGQLHIYKRVPDYYSSTVENRVFTDLNAELQADGTYKIVMETYATDPTQYQMVEERPTDFIFVVDASSSMTNNSDVYTYTSQGVQNITFNNVEGGGKFIYYDGEYCELSRHKYHNGDGFIGIGRTYYHCVDFRTSDNRVFHLTPNGIVDTTLQGDGPDGTDNICKTTGVGQNKGGGDTSHGSYEIFSRTGETRLAGMKRAMGSLIDSIAGMNADHRMAVVTFGSDAADDVAWLNTGLYTNTSTAMVQYSGSGTITPEAYSSVFYNKDQKNTVKNIINAIDTSSKGDSDTFVNYGFDMANNIIDNSDATYVTAKDMSATTNRNVCIIMLTDGIPGKGGSDITSATNVANESIKIAKELKAKGAYVYTVQLGNNNMDGFNMHNYLEYVSSNYLVAENMTTPGSRNTDRIDYHYDFNLSSFTTDDVLSAALVSSIKDNSGNATAILGPDAVIYQKLTDAFIIPEDATVKTELVDGYYDAIGRLTFDDENGTLAPSTITSTLTKNDRQLYVKGYDYSARYIGDRKPGQKLRVTITGVLANGEAEDIINTSINDTSTTAVWESIDHEVPFKYFPYKTFSIPEYNYALDFGFDMLDVDVNGELIAVSDTLSKLDTTKYPVESTTGMVAIQTTGENSHRNLIYSHNPEVKKDSAYVLIYRDEGENPENKYDWFKINIVPASNIYYEQDGFKTGASGKAEWTNDGTPAQTYQDLSVAETDTYGYDSHYANGKNAHSNGAAKKVTISKTNNKSATQTFEFYGTGFDLVSACGATTGTLAVKVSDKDGKLVKAYLVDTYCSDTSLTTGEDGLLCQVPIVSFANDTGIAEKYKVEVTAIYLSTSNALKPVAASVTETVPAGELEATTAVVEDNSAIYDELAALGMNDIANADLELVWFDDNSILNGGTGANGKVDDIEMAGDSTVTELNCYLDGFRIYHPLNTDYTGYIPSEQGATYLNVLNNISNIYSDSELVDETVFSSFAYIVGSGESSFTFGNYKEKGPQNELYLKTGGNAIAFKVQRQSPNGEVHLGLRAVTGTTKIKVSSGEKAVTFDVNSATEMYYDITEFITTDATGVANITIQNVGTGVLAVNNIKLTGNNTAPGLSEDDLSTFSIALNATAEEAVVDNGKVTVEKPEEPATPGVDAPTEKTFFEILIDFVKNLFDKILAFLTNVLAKGGNF